MPNSTFSIVYDGPPVLSGTMDARDLAPALLALADLVDEAGPLASESTPHISLRVRPNFKEGSFEIFFEITSLYERFVGIFSGPDAQAWSAVFQIIGISGAVGLLQLIRRSKGKKPRTVSIEHSERVTVTFEGDEPVTIDRGVWALFQNARARKAAERMVAPLTEKGFDTLKIKHQGKETLSVTEDDAPFFVAPVERAGETFSEIETRVVIVSPSFNAANKWRVSDGARTIYVAIRDEEFQTSVQSGSEAFRKGDVLFVTLATTQWFEEGKLKAELSISKVHDHIPGPQQSPLL